MPLTRRAPAPHARGAAFWLIFIPVAVVGSFALDWGWTRSGLQPIAKLPLNHWFGWAGTLGTLVAALTAALISDFLFYWLHRLQHGPLWRFHAVHHSVRELNALNSYHHISDVLFRLLLTNAPLLLVALSAPTAPLPLLLLLVLQPYYLHSPTRLNFGPVRYALCDNRYHRIHHSLEPGHFDKNFGIITPLWDVIFGTAYFPQPDEWPAVGLADIDEPRSIRDWFDLPLRYHRAAAPRQNEFDA
jgi:sterol desaturase/sphingolipid hydroxylase (fatty acid hydroxylase superfamily)